MEPEGSLPHSQAYILTVRNLGKFKTLYVWDRFHYSVHHAWKFQTVRSIQLFITKFTEFGLSSEARSPINPLNTELNPICQYYK